MSIKRLTSLSILAAIASGAAATAAADRHIGIDAVDGRLTTFNYQSGVGYLNTQRVFTNIFDADLFFTDDNGTNMPGGTLATPGAVGFNILGSLLVWDSGLQNFVSTDHTINISAGPASVDTADGFVAGFGTNVRDEISHPDNSAQWGRHHTHFGYTLNGPEGTPSDGIYLLNLEWWYEAGDGNPVSYDTSLPFWTVFGLNVDDTDLLNTAQWVRDNVVPAPGAAAILGLAALAGVRRRR
ncbi:MAG: hypothetical protein EA379_03520 [Phycisphaerales bacterium]|nr:MAG: hypothetical protein EA379_03520 [Phycisphaerales bacterium]